VWTLISERCDIDREERNCLTGRLLRCVSISLLVAAAAVAAPVCAAFSVESIVVRGTHYSSPRTIIKESKLAAGHSYTEAELRDAIGRVNRLPFVIHAEPSLEKGSARGQYVVVITITETKPLFIDYGWSKQLIDDRESSFVPGPDGKPVLQTRHVLFRFNEHDARAGLRVFAGSGGMVTISSAYSGCDSPGSICFAQVADITGTYTQYDILGTRASVAGIVQFRNTDFRPPPFAEGSTRFSVFDRLAFQFSGVVPLFGNNALRASVSRRTDPVFVVKQLQPFVFHERMSHPTGAQLAWLYDTTDDPLFPQRGSALSISTDWRRSVTQLFREPTRAKALITKGGDVNFHKHWDLGGGRSLSSGGEVSRRSKENEFVVEGGYSASLWGREQTMRLGDLRLQTTVDRHLIRFTTVHSQTSYSTLGVGIAYRGQWGIVSAGVSYLGFRSEH
jgi:hypothetical protein